MQLSQFDEIASVVKKESAEQLAEITNVRLRTWCEEWIKENMASLKDMLSCIDDADDVKYAVAMRYASMKANWIELNTRIGYAIAASGEASEDVVFHASFVAFILGKIEPYVDTRALDKICQTLNDPMNLAA